MTALSRRDFTRFLVLSGSATLLPERAFASGLSLDDVERAASPLPRTPEEPDEKFWREVRGKFLIPRDVAFLNAAKFDALAATYASSVACRAARVLLHQALVVSAWSVV